MLNVNKAEPIVNKVNKELNTNNFTLNFNKKKKVITL